MLSAYLDGKLDPTLRGSIEDHISRCEDCYFVVRETAVGADEQSRPLTAPSDIRSSANKGYARFAQSRLALALAAGMALSLGALSIWRQQKPTADDLRDSLVTAVGERRSFDARLTGGFRFGATVSAMRGNSRDAARVADDWEVIAAADRIARAIPLPRSAAESSTLAASRLMLGQRDDAVVILETALNRFPEKNRDRAGLLSDLSAAYLSRAEISGGVGDFQRALDASTAAIEIDPGFHEAYYNRAVALEGVGDPKGAAQAWGVALSQEPDAAWRRHIGRKKRDLDGKPGSSSN